MDSEQKVKSAVMALSKACSEAGMGMDEAIEKYGETEESLSEEGEGEEEEMPSKSPKVAILVAKMRRAKGA